jgi:hypothetical protein
MGNLLYLNEKANIICWKRFHYERIAREINDYRPTVLEANPSLLGRFCFWALDNGVQVYSPDVITFTYELPSSMHLAAIRKVFKSLCQLLRHHGDRLCHGYLRTGPLHQNTEYTRIDSFP